MVQDLAKQPLEVFCGCELFINVAEAKYIHQTGLAPVAEHVRSVPKVKQATTVSRGRTRECTSMAAQGPWLKAKGVAQVCPHKVHGSRHSILVVFSERNVRSHYEPL